MRRLDPDFVPHEIPFVIPSDTFLRSFPGVKLLNGFPDMSTLRAHGYSEKSYHEAIPKSKKRGQCQGEPLFGDRRRRT